MKQNKYKYLNVIQQYYTGSYGWEDVSEYEAYSNGNSKEYEDITVISKKTGLPVKRIISSCGKDLKEYLLMGYPTRVIFRKELNQVTS